MRHGVPGKICNIAGGTDLTTAQLTGVLLEVCGADPALVTYVPDRRANDRRYAMDWSKIATQLGYRPARPEGGTGRHPRLVPQPPGALGAAGPCPAGPRRAGGA